MWLRTYFKTEKLSWFYFAPFFPHSYIIYTFQNIKAVSSNEAWLFLFILIIVILQNINV